MFAKISRSFARCYAPAVLALCVGLNARAANLADIRVSYRLDPWLVSGNYLGGLWVSPPVFGPVTQGGGTLTVQVKALGLDTLGQSVAIAPQWTSSDPSNRRGIAQSRRRSHPYRVERRAEHRYRHHPGTIQATGDPRYFAERFSAG